MREETREKEALYRVEIEGNAPCDAVETVIDFAVEDQFLKLIYGNSTRHINLDRIDQLDVMVAER